MKAHDVRRLRHCPECDDLADKDDFLTDGSMCVTCAYRKAGSAAAFAWAHTKADCLRLRLDLIGPNEMRKLLDIVENL